MELTWLMKLRIAAAITAGVVLIGIFAWPLVAPPDTFGVVSLASGSMSFRSAIILVGLAFVAGLLAYFLSWPHGREIGILAVPSGLAVWAVRSGNMAALMRLNPTVAQRQELFAALKWEPFFWLVIVGMGFLGVLFGQVITGLKPAPHQMQEKPISKTPTYLNAIFAVVSSVLIAQFCIGVFAQDVRIGNSKLGSVVAQPVIGQIVFAVLLSFMIAAFLVKKLLKLSYVWSVVASALVLIFVYTIYIKQDTVQYLVSHYPAVFFSNSAVSILPLQMVAFGTLGSILGYWGIDWLWASIISEETSSDSTLGGF